MIDETRTRFLAAIARQIPAERVIEVHLFAAIRQGGMESGVAVIALEREAAPSPDVDGGPIVPAAVAESAFVADEVMAERSPYADESPDTVRIPRDDDASQSPAAAGATPTLASRYTIYSARYRYTLKGLDRGKWEVSVTEEADAPLLTVAAVVRGVQRRSGEADEVIRLSGDEFRGALPTVQHVS